MYELKLTESCVILINHVKWGFIYLQLFLEIKEHFEILKQM